MSRRRILLVDDDSRTLRIVARYLGIEGYEVHTAAGGQAGLEAVGKRPPDLVIMDMTMPGLDGLEVCRRLRLDSATAAVPVILVAGMARSDDVDRARSAGANHLISKPFNLTGLGAFVRSLLPPEY